MTSSSDKAESPPDDRDAALMGTSGAGSRRHIPALDGVRGLAILVVVLSHAAEPSALRASLSIPLLRLAEAGWWGVDLFFVLSGFLITGILYDTREGPHYFRNFYARRAMRIFPLYYAFLAALFLLGPQIRATSGVSDAIGRDQVWFWLYGVNFLVAWRGSMFPMAHFWSLAVEEHFYLAWPGVVFALRRRTLMALCVVLACVAIVCRLVVIPRYGVFAAYVLTPCRMDSLALGALAALAVRGPRGHAAIAPIARVVAAAGAAGLLALVFSGGFAQFDPAVLVWGYPALDLTCAAVIVLAASPGPTLLGAAFDNRVLRTLGKYSYAMYVLHLFVISSISKILPMRRVLGSADLGFFVWSAAIVAATMAVAMVSWYLFERPILTLKRFFSYGPAPAPARLQGDRGGLAQAVPQAAGASLEGE